MTIVKLCKVVVCYHFRDCYGAWLPYNTYMAARNEVKKMTIVRINQFGYLAYQVIDNETGEILVTFDTYYDAVNFILFMETV